MGHFPLKNPKRMVDRLLKEGIIESREVEEAFLKVERSLFVPTHEKREAYDMKAINLIPGTSSISQPQVVASMLEALKLKKGQKVLEIGTASGYNAALLSQLVGEDKNIYTVEYMESLVQRARENLKNAGHPGIHVIHGDGCKGYLHGAPYHRIIITASSPCIPLSLWAQLEEGGRLVLPYDFCNLITLLVAIEKQEGKGVGEIFGFPVLFVPLQGEGLYRERDLKKYRQYVMKKREDKTIGYSLTLISYYQNEGRVNLREVEEMWRRRGEPEAFAYTLHLLEDGHLRVRWES